MVVEEVTSPSGAEVSLMETRALHQFRQQLTAGMRTQKKMRLNNFKTIHLSGASREYQIPCNNNKLRL